MDSAHPSPLCDVLLERKCKSPEILRAGHARLTYPHPLLGSLHSNHLSAQSTQGLNEISEGFILQILRSVEQSLDEGKEIFRVEIGQQRMSRLPSPSSR